MSVTCHKRAVDQLDLHAKVAGLQVPLPVRKPAAASVSNSIEKSIERGHEDSTEASAPTVPMASRSARPVRVRWQGPWLSLAVDPLAKPAAAFRLRAAWIEKASRPCARAL